MVTAWTQPAHHDGIHVASGMCFAAWAKSVPAKSLRRHDGDEPPIGNLVTIVGRLLH